MKFYSHVNYSVTKIYVLHLCIIYVFYSHVNYSVTKMEFAKIVSRIGFTVT